MTLSKFYNIQPKLLFLAITASVLLFTACNDDDDGPGELNPEITSVEPQSGPVGTEVTITGSDFSPTATENTVTFAGTEAVVVEASESQLVVTVPEGAESGAVEVTVDGNTATGPNFTVEGDTTNGGGELEITGIEPQSGPVGTEVTITGSGFSATAEENTVVFSPDVTAEVTEASESELVVTVPDSAETGPIEITVDGNTVTSTTEFTVEGDDTTGTPMLEIASVDPDSAAVGEEVVIFGSGFSATPDSNLVTFSGIEAVVTRASTDSLHTEVPEGATDGPIEVEVGGEIATYEGFVVLEDTTGT